MSSWRARAEKSAHRELDEGESGGCHPTPAQGGEATPGAAQVGWCREKWEKIQ